MGAYTWSLAFLNSSIGPTATQHNQYSTASIFFANIFLQIVFIHIWNKKFLGVYPCKYFWYCKTSDICKLERCYGYYNDGCHGNIQGNYTTKSYRIHVDYINVCQNIISTFPSKANFWLLHDHSIHKNHSNASCVTTCYTSWYIYDKIHIGLFGILQFEKQSISSQFYELDILLWIVH